MKAKTGFGYAAAALLIGALVHIAGLVMGPSAVEFLGAPPNIVASAEAGTWPAPVTTLAITALLAALAGMAWTARQRSGQKLIRICLWVFGVIFLLRGLLIVLFLPAILRWNFGPDPLKFTFHFGASLFVLTIGLALLIALIRTQGGREHAH